MFIGDEIDHFAPVFHRHRRNLAVEIPGVHRRRRALLALQRKGVLIGPADGVFTCDVFGRHAHMPGAKGAIQRAQHHILRAHIAHLGTPALIGNDKG